MKLLKMYLIKQTKTSFVCYKLEDGAVSSSELPAVLSCSSLLLHCRAWVTWINTVFQLQKETKQRAPFLLQEGRKKKKNPSSNTTFKISGLSCLFVLFCFCVVQQKSYILSHIYQVCDSSIKIKRNDKVHPLSLLSVCYFQLQ